MRTLTTVSWVKLHSHQNMTDNFNFVTKTSELVIISYNMHRFRHELSTVLELIKYNAPDIFIQQEQWIICSSLIKFSLIIYVLVTLLRLKPFPLVFYGSDHLAGLLLFLNTITIASNDRYFITKVADWLFDNIYLPCVSTNDRWTMSFNTLNEIFSWCEQFNNLSILYGGDFNCDLSSKSDYSSAITDFFKLAPVT